MNKSEIIAQAAEYLDVFTSKMEKMPDTANVKRLVAELYAIAASAGDAPDVQGEPVAWSGWGCQYPGKMPRLYGDRRIAELNCDWENGDQVLHFTAAPQPAPDVAGLVEALEQCITSMLDSGYRADAVVIRAARYALAAHRREPSHDNQ